MAIAGQAITGRALGAGDVVGVCRAGRRMLQWGFCAGMAGGLVVIGLRPWLGELFSDDPEVVVLAGFLMWWVALLQPVNGIVFVLDGLLWGGRRALPGPGDGRRVRGVRRGGRGGAGHRSRGRLALGGPRGAHDRPTDPLWRRFEHGAWAVTGATR